MSGWDKVDLRDSDKEVGTSDELVFRRFFVGCRHADVNNLVPYLCARSIKHRNWINLEKEFRGAWSGPPQLVSRSGLEYLKSSRAEIWAKSVDVWLFG